MSERRKLVAGIAQEAPPASQERKFVFGTPVAQQRSVHAPATLPRTPVTTRIRDDYAKALKRISLQRQMEGTAPNTLQDILEEAIEAWLRANGELAGD